MSGNCLKCGGSLGDFDAGGDMICDSCEARGSSGGEGADVPCQRCGMYLPRHELQMWSSRLYCAYCIMDVKDEENYGREKKQTQSSEIPFLGGVLGASESPARKLGTCQRCGKATDTLYTLSGTSLCASCYFPEGSPEAGSNPPGRFGQIVTFIKKQLKVITLQPKAVPADPRPTKIEDRTFDIRGRKMADKEEQTPPGGAKSGENSPVPEKGAEKKPVNKDGEGKRDSFYSFKDKTEPRKK